MGFKEPTSLPTKESCDDAFHGSGKVPGLEIWRIEKFKVLKCRPNGTDKEEPAKSRNEAHQGKLCSGDSYIFLHTKKRDNALERDIFFWLGKDSSQDERGACAYKTVELDTYHDDEPTQHREVQGHETSEFLDLFKKIGGLQYIEGGVESGFRKVDRDAYRTRLLHIKGRRHIVTSEVKLEAASLNENDVFVLDTKHDIYQWNGKDASRLEKQHAMEVTRKIRDNDHNKECRATIHILEQDQDDDSAFWEKFGCAKPASIAKGVDDKEAEAKRAADIKLFHLSDASGSMQVSEVSERPLKKDMLKEEDAYILSTGATGIFVWIGKGASKGEKLHSMKYATQFITDKGLPDWTPVTRVVMGAETQMFKQYFPGWKDPVILPGQAPEGQRKSKFRRQTFDHRALFEQRKRELERLPDDGSGKLTVWRVEKREKVQVKESMVGHFYSGDSYVILYEYKDQRGKDAAFIYFWQGHRSSQDERADSAIMAMHLDDEMGGYPVQVRVVQGKEPPHFFKIFETYGICIHEGGIGSGFKNRNEEDKYDTDGTRLFHIRGTNDFNTRAVQVREEALSLNSGDCFILESPEQVYLWFGKGCSGDEREFTHKIRKRISFQSKNQDPVLVTEGQEPADFWKALATNSEDGPKAYAAKPREEDAPEVPPRLFQCSDARGYFWAEEIFDFDQEDLVEDDVMVLDTFREVFVWLGSGAKDNERKDAMEMAKKYVADGSEVTGRTPEDTCFVIIKQGMEPINFTCNFHGWDDDKWRGGKTYEEMKAELEASNPEEASKVLDIKIDDAIAKVTVGGVIYSYETLTRGERVNGEFTTPPTYPEGIDLTQKEQYLSDEDFEKHLGVAREDFAKMPKWKQLNAKKKCKLF